MPAYRLYCVDGAGSFARARWIAADDDQQAISYVQGIDCPHHRCELWERERLVADIPPADNSKGDGCVGEAST
jgi:hypothetical protein